MNEPQPQPPAAADLRSRSEVCADIIAALHTQRAIDEQRARIFDEHLLHLALTGEVFQFQGLLGLDADTILDTIWPLVTSLPQDQQYDVLAHYARSRQAALGAQPDCPAEPRPDTPTGGDAAA